ncbi:MAG: 3-deoxy-7-phosphoheptulonate synthase [Deltaproteobacteria bacterium]|nr:MAG: 3-deoxy-7-phosphoheptulonate synthase [Deltaproteobacteria bacterium]
MKPTFDLRIKDYRPLLPPDRLKEMLPASAAAYETVLAGREAIGRILDGSDRRLMVICGPCSIHDEKAALEYAERLAALSREVSETLLVVMRVYFEKPRTTVGWKGLINDPRMDGTCDIEEGLYRARRILLAISELGLPAGTEMLDPITPQYVDGLVSWAAIGARTTESQTHREMASGLSMPVGFKNGTDGNLAVAINAMLAARVSQSFVGIDRRGHTCIVTTTGNHQGHLVMRGGRQPNYDSTSIEAARMQLVANGLPEAIVVDCSHANSLKKHQGQPIVWRNIIEQRLRDNESIVGLMLESNLFEGNQKFTGDPGKLRYGVSLTDECISWETTEQLLRWADQRLRGADEAARRAG